jgi:CRP/FNR family transcriptional regulator/CRP/FNR family cyclic AMP-dependent transcriptional regulator
MIGSHIADTLAGTPLLRGLPPDALATLTSIARRRTYKRGEVIFHMGDPGDTLFILESGRVKVYSYAESGEETVLAIVGPGSCFGELALIDGEPRSATVEALEPVEAVSIGRTPFQGLLQDHPQTGQFLLRVLAAKIRYLTGVVSDLAFLDLEGRLAKKLLELADEYGKPQADGVLIDIVLPQDVLAHMVGATRASVNKLIGWYEDRGMIARRGRRIAVLQPDRLRSRIV